MLRVEILFLKQNKMNITKNIATLAALGLASQATTTAATTSKTPTKPNILIILVDDMGYSDLGCYGSEIHTPNIDRLASKGVRFSQFHNCAKSFPSRASLMTGLYFQRTEVAEFSHTATLGEVLRPAGYQTWWTGKHHSRFNPVTRGFDHYYGMIGGGENHFNPWSVEIPGQPRPDGKANEKAKIKPWMDDLEKVTPWQTVKYDTDGFTDKALKWLDDYKKDDKPFLLYVAYTAPHYPLQAWPEDIAKYKGVYDSGYDAVRQARYKRQIGLGLIDPKTSPLPPFENKKKNKEAQPELSAEELHKEAMKMEIYAAMVDRVDQNVGRLVKKLEEQGKLDNTIIMFLSDNGGCAETPKTQDADPNAPMGSVATYITYGQNWATVSNTPLRKWKQDSFEGGIGTPFIVQWPAAIKPQTAWNREPAHLIDIMPTLVAISGAKYPGSSKETDIKPMDGVSLLPAFKGKTFARINPLYFQFSKGSAVIDGQWKMVRDSKTWELYDMATDRTETINLADQKPEMVQKLDVQWLTWWKDCTGSDWTGKVTKEKKEKNENEDDL